MALTESVKAYDTERAGELLEAYAHIYGEVEAGTPYDPAPEAVEDVYWLLDGLIQALPPGATVTIATG